MKFRAFLAVDLDERFRAERILTELRTSGADLKVVEPRNLHITLKFLGDTEEELVEGIAGAMRESSEGVAPFEVAFRGLGAFPNPGYLRVIWVGLEGAGPLGEIARRLDDSLSKLGFKKEGGFSPHITVARVRTPRNKARLQDILKDRAEEDLGSMRVDRIALKKSVLSSAGPAYSTVREVELRG